MTTNVRARRKISLEFILANVVETKTEVISDAESLVRGLSFYTDKLRLKSLSLF